MITALKNIKSKLFPKRGLAHAETIFTHTTKAERKLLLQLASEAPGHALEIGSYLGASSCYIAEGLKNKNAKLICVDTWQNDAMEEGKKDTFEMFSLNTRDYKHIIEARRGKSSDMATANSLEFGFAFFDGDHSYQGIKTDWESWKSSLKQGATICFHDYGWADGVQRVVREEILPIAKESGSLPNLFWAKI